MSLFWFRMKDRNTVIVYAKDERSAKEAVGEMGLQSTVARAREIRTFAAMFSLSDSGDLLATLLHPGTLKELAPDYPLVQAARAHSYADFGGSRTDDRSKPVLFEETAARKGLEPAGKRCDWGRCATGERTLFKLNGRFQQTFIGGVTST